MESNNTSRALVRLGIGLLQGGILAGLYLASDHDVFPATAPQVFAPLLMAAVFIPLLVSQGLGNLRRPTLIVWSVMATLIVAGLAWYDIWHAWPQGDEPALSARIVVILAIFLFVAHALVSCGDADRRIVARYPTLFDLAWKLGVQIAIILCFLGAFWIMLWLGMALFDMIGFAGFGRFITDAPIAIPLTTIAAAAALHATDASAALVRGVRSLALTLLSWLLPVIAAIAFAFLVSLAVTGLQPLWATRSAAFLLIAATSVLVIHINAAYQDGSAGPPHILRVAGTLAAVMLAFLVWIAAYALVLRVSQYGWTADRITSAACVAVAAMFALGYLIAAVVPGPWLKFIERWNVYGTFFFLLLLFALATPIADPMRLSVIDQVQRLKAGAAKADKFDFAYLHWHGGRFGWDALTELAASRDPVVAEGAKRSLATGVSPAMAAIVSSTVARQAGAPDISMKAYPAPTADDIRRQVTVYPKGQSLPESFVRQDWRKIGAPVCFSALRYPPKESLQNYECAAILADFDGDGRSDILIFERSGNKDHGVWSSELFRQEGGGWHNLAGFVGLGSCDGELAALKEGRFATVPAPARDLVIDGRHIPIVPSQAAKCPAPR